MPLPTFLLIGAPKAGSTGLYHALRSHPQVFMPQNKEPGYFLDTGNQRRGREWYEGLFAEAGNASAIGEASVLYTTYPRRDGVAESVAELLPEAKLVYLVRNPVERMISHYMHNLRYYGERRPIADALRTPHYVDVSRYAFQLDRYLRYYPPEQVHVMLAEHLRDDRAATLAAAFNFLGVDPGHHAPFVESELNRGSTRPLPRKSMRWLMATRGIRRVARRVPRRIALAARRITYCPYPDPAVPPDLFDALGRLFRDDVRRLRPFLGPDWDGWGIA